MQNHHLGMCSTRSPSSWPFGMCSTYSRTQTTKWCFKLDWSCACSHILCSLVVKSNYGSSLCKCAGACFVTVTILLSTPNYLVLLLDIFIPGVFKWVEAMFIYFSLLCADTLKTEWLYVYEHVHLSLLFVPGVSVCRFKCLKSTHRSLALLKALRS